MRSWSKVYLSDEASEAPMAAVEKLLPNAFAGLQPGLPSFTKVPITVQLADDRVRFSGPSSSVNMELMEGFGSKSVQIPNLPNPGYQG